MNLHSNSESDTIKAARDFASGLTAGDVIFLSGPLGAGKSVFARALIRALAGDENLDVPSPTFTLVQSYESPRGPLHHFDLYRIHAPDDVIELGWEEALSGITIIEWPERLGPYRPSQYIDIVISPVPGKAEQRIIVIENKNHA